MTDDVRPLTAKAKLAVSRAQLLQAMGYEEIPREASEWDGVQVVHRAKSTRSAAGDGPGKKVKNSILGRWWRRHPLHTAVELGQPFLQDYATRHPGRLVTYGAATGAALWIIKPWRLLSVGTVVMLLVKTTDMAGWVMDTVRGGSAEVD